MGSKNCMNESCGGTTSCVWKKGWGLKSGGFAKLCYSCGSAHENSFFCETFHLEESGWRECRVCGKRIHCGCIASRLLYEYADLGGIWCTSCVKRLEVHPMPTPIQIPVDIPNGTFILNGIQDVRPTIPENRIDGDKFNTEKLLQLTKAIGANNTNAALGQSKQDDSILKPRQSGKPLLNLEEQCSEPAFIKSDSNRPKEGVKPIHESLVHQTITLSLTRPLTSTSIGMPFPGGIIEGSEQSKSSLQQGQRSRQILPKPPKSSSTPGSGTNKGTSLQARVARPPAEGRGRNQLLPRYWPRITDQELQQLSGEGSLKSTIVPLFEKILSASDAGRIGRLVLPKACAEAYFPAINQSEGIPIRIQDIKGKEWTFQFRFWPNNNSRMYVLEGVTPCIQNMQVQAGDTVTFSRIDPGGQLVIGCRKATNNPDMHDPQTAAFTNGDSAGETSVLGANGNGASNGRKALEDSLQRHNTMLEKKKARNIKNKRLVMHSDDVMELRVTWEEAQELLRPSPTSKPTVVMVEDHEFEEFEEPPVFGKRTVFTSQPTGEKEQLAQCDNCSKWRRLPVHVLLPVKWTCSDNIWDSERNSCAAAEDINPKHVENFIYRDSKTRRISSDNRVPKQGEPSGLDALATAAALGDNLGDIVESSVGATTRHPRHRPGCTCIVCIQPPSGKGKHEPTCKCNVCLTVKRRFRTLMMRKKKRQSEREAELAQGKDNDSYKNGSEKEVITGDVLLITNHPNIEMDQNGSQVDVEVMNKGQLDLNCDPHRGDGILASAVETNLTTITNAATEPSDFSPAQNGLPIMGPSPQTVAENEENVADQLLTSGGAEQENDHADG